MALAHINNRVQGGGSATATTIVSPAANHTAGNGLVCLVSMSPTGSFSAIANTAGDTWVQAATFLAVTNNNRFYIYYVNSCIGHATDVVTFTLDITSTYRSIVVHEISGQDTAGMFNTSSTGDASGPNITTGSLTISASEEMILALMVHSPTITAGTGYTLVNFAVTGDATAYFADEYKIITASEAATATGSGATFFGILAASFKAASAGGAVRYVNPLTLLGVQ